MSTLRLHVESAGGSVAGFIIVASLLSMQLQAFAQPLDRDSVAVAINAAEQSRASYHVVFEWYAAGPRPTPGQRRVYERLTDGLGRGRRTDTAPVEDLYGDINTAVWSDDATLVLKKSSTDQKKPQLLTVDNKHSESEHLDQFEQALGLRFETSPRRPSDVIADRNENVIIRYAEGQDSGLVEVVFINPSFLTHSVITNVYDPTRQWGLVQQRLVYSLDEVTGEDIPADRQGTFGSREMTGWKRSNGAWVPMHVHASSTFHPGKPNEQTLQAITEIQEFEVDPSTSDADFEIPTDQLPKGSAIVDETLGISYKLGENRLYMDGRLHKLNQPVSGLISAEDLPAIMQDAIALIPPDTPPLQPVAGTTSSWRVGGYSFLAGGVVLLGAVFWMRRRGAGS